MKVNQIIIEIAERDIDIEAKKRLKENIYEIIEDYCDVIKIRFNLGKEK